MSTEQSMGINDGVGMTHATNDPVSPSPKAAPTPGDVAVPGVSLTNVGFLRLLAASNHREGLTTTVMSAPLIEVCDLLIEQAALIRRYASECGECGGRGLRMTHPAGAVGDCFECADIRALVAKVRP